MGLHLLYGAALFGASVHALAFPGPQPTDPFQALPQNGWSARPTPAPEAHVVLRRQQNILPSTYLLAPDNTCGFINGIAKSAYACMGDDMKCAFIPSSSKVAGAAGCCKGDDCAFRVSCVGDADIDDDCDSKCQADALTLKCTGSAKFCATVSFPGGVTDYYCGTKRVIGVLRAQTTNADDKTRTMSTVKVTSTTTKASSTTTSKTSSTSSASQSSSTSSGASSSTSAAPKTTSSATNTAVAGAATSSAPPVATTAAPTPVGAIVGGVIGGIALIALIVLGAVFLRQHKKKHAASELSPPQPFMSQPSFSTTQPPAPSYAQTTASSRMSYEPMPHTVSSATATPAQMYAVPATAAAGGAAGGAAAAAAGAFNSYHNSSNNHNNNRQQHHPGSIHSNNYPDPSPLTTPGHSPNPQYQHQPRAPPPLPQPSYYNHANHSPQPSHDHGPWMGAGAGAVEPPDRQSTSTPVSTYNGTTPVSPASALGPMPGEPPHQQQQGAMGGVPLILQPGMGYRPYRPGNSSAPGPAPSRAGSGSGSESINGGGNGSGSKSGSEGAAGVRAVAAGSPGPEGPRQAQAAVVVPQQAQAVAVNHNHNNNHPHPDESRGHAVELP